MLLNKLYLHNQYLLRTTKYKSKQIIIAVETQKSKGIDIPKPSDLKFRPIVDIYKKNISVIRNHSNARAHIPTHTHNVSNIKN